MPQFDDGDQYGVEAYRWVVLAIHFGLLFNANISVGSYILMPKLIEESFKENAYVVYLSILMSNLIVAPTSFLTAKMYDRMKLD